MWDFAGCSGSRIDWVFPCLCLSLCGPCSQNLLGSGMLQPSWRLSVPVPGDPAHQGLLGVPSVCSVLFVTGMMLLTVLPVLIRALTSRDGLCQHCCASSSSDSITRRCSSIKTLVSLKEGSVSLSAVSKDFFSSFLMLPCSCPERLCTALAWAIPVHWLCHGCCGNSHYKNPFPSHRLEGRKWLGLFVWGLLLLVGLFFFCGIRGWGEEGAGGV